MRKDMSKVITECYRLGGWYSYKNRRTELKQQLNKAVLKEDYDFLENRESIGFWAVKDWNNKEFGEHLEPLRRFLESSVGELWDDVHSEMAQHINLNSAVQLHIWQHVDDYVEKQTFMKDGKVYYYRRYGWKRELEVPIEESFSTVYVHPENGILQKTPKKPRRRYKGGDWQYYESYYTDVKWRQCHQIFGIWYIITLYNIPESQYKDFSRKEKEHIKFLLEYEQKYGIETLDYESKKSLKDYKLGKTGYWHRSSYTDVATYDIVASFREKINKEIFPSYNEGMLYLYKNVYAHSRKQMNSNEIRRWIRPEFKM